MAPVEIASSLDDGNSCIVGFRNPFFYALPLEVSLSHPKEEEEPAAEPVFKLMLKNPDQIVLAPRSVCQIGISFNPTALEQYTTGLLVRAQSGGRSLTWAYPIQGVVEAGTPQFLAPISTACKSTSYHDVDIYLKGLGERTMFEKSIAKEAFSVALHAEKNKRLINRALRMDILDIVELSAADQEDSGATYCLKTRLIFEPLKSFSSEVEIVIECKSIGRWRAAVGLNATSPPADDVIRLCAPVGGLDQAKFKLSNRFLGLSNFEAYFAPGSSSHFKVTPTVGVLAPFGSSGTEFVISYAPVQYGPRDIGTLIVMTDDAQWNYDIKGVYPDVSIDKSQISSKLHSPSRSMV
jgi:hypothetical protein